MLPSLGTTCGTVFALEKSNHRGGAPQTNIRELEVANQGQNELEDLPEKGVTRRHSTSRTPELYSAVEKNICAIVQSCFPQVSVEISLGMRVIDLKAG